MDEIKFVLKTFLITCAVVYGMQFKLGDQTADEKLNIFLQKGALTQILRDASQGATRLTASAYNQAKEGNLKNPFGKIAETENAKKKFEDREKENRKRLEELEEYGESSETEP